jgi:ligand-binding sensor domain-containing protein
MKIFKKYKLIFILICHIAFYASTQHTDLYFEHIDYDESFSQSMISSIYQTEKGFIWMGTKNGLVRYDGYNFLRYTRDINGEGSISNNYINVIYEDDEENLWICTNNGLNLFNKKLNNFVGIGEAIISTTKNNLISLENQEKELKRFFPSYATSL